MNYFLMLLLILVCGGGYYEYNAFELKSTADTQQITDLGNQVTTLQAQNKKLTDANTELTKGSNDAQTEMADLTKQLQTAQSSLAEIQQKAAAAQSAEAAATPPPPKIPPVGNGLGNLTTLDGKSYQDCQLLKVQADCIVINDSTGITQIPYNLMPPELQQRFGYNPHLGAALPEAQVEAMEEKRKAAAAQTAGN